MRDLRSLEKIAVTGATGFIGAHVVSELVASGCRLILSVRSPKDRDRFGPYGANLRAELLDPGDPASLAGFIRKERPSVVIHLAGTRGRTKWERAAVACLESNTLATVRLLSAALDTGVKRIVVMGSAEEYGSQSGPLNESLPVVPDSPYGISKAAATALALALHRSDACPVVVLRPFSVYGPGQPLDMFIAEAVAAAVRNAPFRMTEGLQRRDPVFVRDVVRAIIAAAATPRIDGNVINIGCGQAYRLKDVASMIWKLTGSASPLLIGERHDPSDRFTDTWANVDKARTLLGWEAQTNLEAGLAETIAFARQSIREDKQLCQAM
jgi:nucleoside-diphosphate-sugar epimerase